LAKYVCLLIRIFILN